MKKIGKPFVDFENMKKCCFSIAARFFIKKWRAQRHGVYWGFMRIRVKIVTSKIEDKKTQQYNKLLAMFPAKNPAKGNNLQNFPQIQALLAQSMKGEALG